MKAVSVGNVKITVTLAETDHYTKQVEEFNLTVIPPTTKFSSITAAPTVKKNTSDCIMERHQGEDKG